MLVQQAQVVQVERAHTNSNFQRKKFDFSGITGFPGVQDFLACRLPDSGQPFPVPAKDIHQECTSDSLHASFILSQSDFEKIPSGEIPILVIL
jgi:hypothetical protein